MLFFLRYRIALQVFKRTKFIYFNVKLLLLSFLTCVFKHKLAKP